MLHACGLQGKPVSHLWWLQRVAICEFDLQPAAGRLEGVSSRGRQEHKANAERQVLDGCCRGVGQAAVGRQNALLLRALRHVSPSRDTIHFSVMECELPASCKSAQDFGGGCAPSAALTLKLSPTASTLPAMHSTKRWAHAARRT